MGNRLDTYPAEALEAETRRLSRLARGLLYAEHDAEDVVQEAWLTVLRPEGEGPRTLKGWLAGTVRGLAVTTRRAEARRRRREQSAARPESIPSAAHAAGRIEVLRLLLEAVDSLEEPYKRTIVLRFFDDLPLREIARDEGVSVNTVHSRVQRGLEQLRKRLDAGREGRRRDLLAALVPLAGRPPWVAGPLASAASSLVQLGGVQVMRQQVKLVVLALGLLLIGGAGWMALSGGTSEVEDSISPPTELEGAVALAPDLQAEQPVVAERVVAEPILPGERDWVVRGQATLANTEALPDTALVARLYAGASTNGELLLEERLSTDQAGGFEWSLPRPDRFTTLVVSIDIDGLDGNSEDTRVAEGDDPPQDLFLSVYPWDLVAVGRVIDPDGGPVAGAHVVGYHVETRTDVEGRYRLRASSYRDEVRATIEAAGYRPERIVAVPNGPGEVQVQDVVLSAGKTLRGRVIDEAGSPVVGAEISAWLAKVQTTSDESGRFELTSIDPEAKEQWLRADGTGFCGQGRLVTPEEFEAGELEWVLWSGAAVRGHVFEEDGSPIQGAHLYLANTPGSIPSEECWSDAQGAFEFPAVQVGENTLWALRDGYQSSAQPVVVPSSGEVLEGLDVRLLAGHWLAGQVIDGANNPVPWTWVYFRGRGRDHHVDAVHADLEGRFRIENLPAGRVMLGFLKDGHPRHDEHFTDLDRGDLLVRLERSGALGGRVVDGLTGEPIPSFRIRFVQPQLEEGERRTLGYGVAWSIRGPGMPFTDTDGYWTTTDNMRFVPGTVTGVQASAVGYAPSIHDRAVVETDTDPDALVIELFAASAHVRGRVTSAEDGAPISGATVRTSRSRQPRAGEDDDTLVLTDELGVFELTGLPVGRTSLVIDHPDWMPGIDGPFDVPPTGTVQRSIELTRGSSLEGRLLDAAGNPLGGEAVRVSAFQVDNPRRGSWEGTTDDDGRFRFEGLQEGSYHVMWRRSLARNQSSYYLQGIVTVDGVSPAEVELKLAGQTTVRGKLGFEAGTPEFTMVSIRPWPPTGGEPGADLSRTHNTVAMDGQFLFDHVEPGSYFVAVFVSGAYGSTEIEVPEAGEIEVWVEVRARDR